MLIYLLTIRAIRALNLIKGQVAFFVIALIIFDDELRQKKVALAIKELRRYLGFPDNLEFKFSNLARMFAKNFSERFGTLNLGWCYRNTKITYTESGTTK